MKSTVVLVHNQIFVMMVLQGLATTPTLTELHQLKARILKHLGDLKGASTALCEGRETDLADRFLNTKAVKYLLAVDDTERVSL